MSRAALTERLEIIDHTTECLACAEAWRIAMTLGNRAAPAEHGSEQPRSSWMLTGARAAGVVLAAAGLACTSSAPRCAAGSPADGADNAYHADDACHAASADGSVAGGCEPQRRRRTRHAHRGRHSDDEQGPRRERGRAREAGAPDAEARIVFGTRRRQDRRGSAHGAASSRPARERPSGAGSPLSAADPVGRSWKINVLR